MKIYITGLPSGYEVEHLVRLFYPMAPLTLTPPEAGEDCVWAEKKPDGLWAMVRQGGNCRFRAAPLPAPTKCTILYPFQNTVNISSFSDNSLFIQKHYCTDIDITSVL